MAERKPVAKPFLKWAGGKSQLLAQFEDLFPEELKDGKIQKYFEPFIGGGAVFFNVAQKYNIRSAVLNDINEELTLVYRVIQKAPDSLMDFLRRFEKRYRSLSETAREKYFYEMRTNYNLQRFQIDYDTYSENWIPRAGQMIFLNKTCYNGLFRLNRSGEFNVPFGRYKNPTILDEENLRNVSRVLQIAEIRNDDFEGFESKVDAGSFVYFDPPYRPISRTSSFTAYSKHAFDDGEQIRLSRFFRRLDEQTGARLMLSNSDPANIDPDDDFFQTHYKKYQLNTVSAARMINSKAKRRGEINELVITNY